MEDMLQINNIDNIDNSRPFAGIAKDIANLLDEHKGQDLCLLDLRSLNTWTDFFIIATATSQTHMDGMEKHLKEHCRQNKIDILGSSRRNKGEIQDEWRLIDLGSIIVHLMTAAAREFYELERLWKV